MNIDKKDNSETATQPIGIIESNEYTYDLGVKFSKEKYVYQIEKNNLSNTVDQDTSEFSHLLKNHLSILEYNKDRIVSAKVISMDKEYITFDVGGKSESRIAKTEFKTDEQEPQIGDYYDVYVEQLEDDIHGKTILSRSKALLEKLWSKLETAYAEETFIPGKISKVVKGGVVVDLGGIFAFLPQGQIDIRPVQDIQSLIGKEWEFKILKMDKSYNNIVISKKAVIEYYRKDKKDEKLLEIQKRMEAGEQVILNGTVKNMTSYGVFIDLGFMDGLVHITDIAWKRVNHPSEILSLGENINVLVLKVDIEVNKRLHLGLKQIGDNPWDTITNKLKINDLITGQVIGMNDNNVFIQLDNYDVEGVLPSYEMSWSKLECVPRAKFIIGMNIKIKVLELESEKQRLLLSVKRIKDNPWQHLINTHKVGDVVDVTVAKVVPYGLFVNLAPISQKLSEIDVLISNAEILYNEQDRRYAKKYAVDDNIKAQILAIHSSGEKVFLGVKQVLSHTNENYEIGDFVHARVISVIDNVINCRIYDKIPATLVLEEEELKEYTEQNNKIGTLVCGHVISNDDKIQIKKITREDNNLF